MTPSRSRRLMYQMLENRRVLASLALETSSMLPTLNSEQQSIPAIIAEVPGSHEVASMSMSMDHGDMDHSMHATFPPLLALVPVAEADAVAVNSGDWSNPATWQSGQLPESGDKVLISQGIHVTFDIQMTEPMRWIRVDGHLKWKTDANTTMMVETLASISGSAIEIGSSTHPIQAGVVAEILIDTTGGAIDKVADPTLLGRGVLTHGRVDVHGAVKTSRVTSVADIVAGQTQLTLSEMGEGWRVGDQILIPGTYTDRTLSPSAYNAADATNSRFHDDVVTIAAINGNTVTLASGTTWAHTRPEGETFDADELNLYVINLTRNIVVRSSDATVPNQQRGHVMLMHSQDVDIAYAQFKDLGRSDKRQIVDDPGINVGGSVGNGNNPRARYGLHLHRIGVMNYGTQMPELTGNVVWGTPGWGIVQHDSQAVLRNNVVFDVVGSGIVAENGNEIGEWIGNTVVKITGDLVNDFDDNLIVKSQRGPRFDLGFTGSGYWVQGGGFGLLMQDNVAASINGAGFDLVHNIDAMAHVETLPVSLIYDPAVRQRYIDAGITSFTPNNVPMRGMSGVEVYNAYRGIHTWSHNRDSQDQEGAFTYGVRTAHDIKSVVSDYTIWGVNNGVQNFYSTLMRYEDGLVVGNIDAPVAFQNASQGNNSKGVGISHNEGDANRIDFDRLRVEGFQYGFQTFLPHNDFSNSLNPLSVSSLDNTTFANVSQAFISSTSNSGKPFSTLFAVDNVSTVGVTGPAATPTFVDSSRGGLSMSFLATVQPDFVGYMWDFDNDGQFDDGVGASVTHTYLSPGTYTVGLKVWDSSARMATTTRTITVSEQPIGNVLVDPGFTGSLNLNVTRDTGWNGRDFIFQNNTAVLDGIKDRGQGFIYQTITDTYRLTNSVDFQFDYLRISSTAGSKMMVSVIGVDNYFGVEQYTVNNIPIRTVGILETPQQQQLVQANLPATSLGQWQTVEFNIDVSQGFKYYFVRFAFDQHRLQNDDAVGIRNVVLSGVSQPIVPAATVQVASSGLMTAITSENGVVSLQQVKTDQLSASDAITLPPLTLTNEVDTVHNQAGFLEDERLHLDRFLFDDWMAELEDEHLLLDLNV